MVEVFLFFFFSKGVQGFVKLSFAFGVFGKGGGFQRLQEG